MKQFIALLLTLIVTLGLCACSSGESFDNSSKSLNNETINSSLSSAEEKYLGTWVLNEATSNNSVDSGLFSFRLLSKGKVIWNSCFYNSDYRPDIITECSNVGYGEWLLDDSQIIIFLLSTDPLYRSTDEVGAFVLKIADDSSLTCNKCLFSKME